MAGGSGRFRVYPAETLTLTEVVGVRVIRLPWPAIAAVASQVQHLSITIVCGRVSSGTEALNVPQPGAMADASNVATTPSWCPRRLARPK